MPTVSINRALIKLVKRLHSLGEEAEEIGHALKDIAVSLGVDDLGRMMMELHDSKHDSKANGGIEKPTP